MCFAPSFLPSPAVRVTRIRESKRRRTKGGGAYYCFT